MSESYDFRHIEPHWQQRWDAAACFRAANPPEAASRKPPFYVLDFFPYPSGAGLHVGHPLGYIASDIIARYKRMRGFNVLHPMGWDAFGLPAEQYAIETGVHPAITTRKNIETYARQLKMIGLSYDWSRELTTCDERYYRWTQWIFLRIYNSWYDPEHRWTDAGGRSVVGAARPIDKLPIPPHVRAEGADAIEKFRDAHRLAFRAEVPVNWCPALGTVLSNEEVTADGRSDRGNHPVFRRPLKQWMLRITEYADRLLSDLEPLDWPEPIKLMQRSWIGRSEGAYIDFALADGAEHSIRVYSTRPDTLYGATYLVLAPEHRLVPVVTTATHRAAVDAYVAAAKQKSDLSRTADAKVKTGVFTGAYATNPINDARVPIWVADYVLATYGTGSIMAVPGADTRDYEFAVTNGLPIVQVVIPTLDALPAGYCVEEQCEYDQDSAHLWALRYGNMSYRTNENVAHHFLFHEQRIAQRFASEVLGNPNARITPQNTSVIPLPFCDDGVAIHSPGANAAHGVNVCDLNGLRTTEAKRKVIAWLEEHDLGEGTVQYKLRDWLFSRQRYWGEPFPIFYDESGRSYSVDDADLPVVLPQMSDFKPSASDDPHAEPQTPLSRAVEWRTHRTAAGVRTRELNTMPQWAGSCWYYLRFLDPANERAFADAGVERYWAHAAKRDQAPAKTGLVDLYMGGAEHAVLHLLYARFWHKVLYDLGIVSTPEPFQKLFNQGMIGAAAYRTERGAYVPAAEVVEGVETEMLHPDETDERALQAALARGMSPTEAARAARKTVRTKFHHGGQPVLQAFEKMSKSLKNVVNPDEIVSEYGADTLRLYEMYMGPLEASKPWNTRDIVGVHRFLQRVWRLVIAEVDEAATPPSAADAPHQPTAVAWRISEKLVDADNPALEKPLHRVVQKVQSDIESFGFNTAIAAMIGWVNEATKAPTVGRGQIERFLRVLSPFAPHLCEELNARLGNAEMLACAPWPAFDERLTRDDTVEIAVQIKGKVRGRVHVATDASDEQMVAAAKALEAVVKELDGKPIQRAIVVRGRLVNLIA